VKNLLATYRDRKVKEKVLGVKDEETAFLERCMNGLKKCERELLSIFTEHISVRKFAAQSGLSRYQVQKESDRLVALLVYLFNEGFM